MANPINTIPMIKLQWYQELHDKHFHRDVWVMSSMKRLAHLTNHLVKYTQGMPRPSTWVDMLACTLSIANTFSLSFTRMYNTAGYTVESIEDVPFTYNSNIEILEAEMKNVLQRLAKLVEGWDHIESIQYRQELEIVLPKLLTLICQRGLINYPELSFREFYGLYIDRLSAIQANHMFYDYYQELMEMSPGYSQVVEFFKPPVKKSYASANSSTLHSNQVYNLEDNYDPTKPNTQRVVTTPTA